MAKKYKGFKGSGINESRVPAPHHKINNMTLPEILALIGTALRKRTTDTEETTNGNENM